MRFNIQERLIDFQSNDEARVIFHTHGWSKFWIKCSEGFLELWEKRSYYYLRFSRHIFLSKVSAKYCVCVITTTIVLTRTIPWKHHTT